MCDNLHTEILYNNYKKVFRLLPVKWLYMKVGILLFHRRRENVMLINNFINKICPPLIPGNLGVFDDLVESEATNKIASQRLEVFVQSGGNLDILLTVHGPLDSEAVFSVSIACNKSSPLLTHRRYL